MIKPNQRTDFTATAALLSPSLPRYSLTLAPSLRLPSLNSTPFQLTISLLFTAKPRTRTRVMPKPCFNLDISDLLHPGSRILRVIRTDSTQSKRNNLFPKCRLWTYGWSYLSRHAFSCSKQGSVPSKYEPLLHHILKWWVLLGYRIHQREGEKRNVRALTSKHNNDSDLYSSRAHSRPSQAKKQG